VVKATATNGEVTKAAGPGSGGLQATSDPSGFNNEAIINQLAESIYKKVVVKINRF
jgi:hypothetical protein